MISDEDIQKYEKILERWEMDQSANLTLIMNERLPILLEEVIDANAERDYQEEEIAYGEELTGVTRDQIPFSLTEVKRCLGFIYGGASMPKQVVVAMLEACVKEIERLTVEA